MQPSSLPISSAHVSSPLGNPTTATRRSCGFFPSSVALTYCSAMHGDENDTAAARALVGAAALNLPAAIHAIARLERRQARRREELFRQLFVNILLAALDGGIDSKSQ
eukprot:4446361-Prymnesium_polylepis.1